ncbi:hypothetical protein [Candidatus Williamhamiltonella defendens]|uniref:hypothetical protein n=1 Tax=Candidatus Williamhamiltonella defendens TaxID=138072 RepID=UPI001F1C4E32|nr:hypothetical protein [Candidatus Hamiltonella defensa]
MIGFKDEGIRADKAIIGFELRTGFFCRYSSHVMTDINGDPLYHSTVWLSSRYQLPAAAFL